MAKKIYSYSIEEDPETLKQFEECYSKKFVKSAALMPDAHSGYAAPIGSVLVTEKFVVPAWVGFDIGCGLIAVKLKGQNIIKKIERDSKEIYDRVKMKIPMGAGEYNSSAKITEKTKKEYIQLLETFSQGEYNKDIYNFLKNSGLKHLGTLGGGNHFIEIGLENKKKNECWLIIHSGSRGIGYKVAEKYMKKAASSENNFEKTFPLEVNSKIGKEYLNILNFGLEYALLNRLEMSYKVIEAIQEVLRCKIISELWTNKNHNHAIPDGKKFVHRKGATPAKKGERGVIPANMRDGSYLVIGLGNSKFLYSSSHGAGRAMSRKKAREKYNLKDFQNSMVGIVGTVSDDTLDEIPMAYKNIDLVMNAQKKSVKIVKKITPIINWKGK